MEQQTVSLQLSELFEIDAAADIAMEHFSTMLAQKVNDLINNDFEKLLRLLYQVDVPEKKLKQELQLQKEDAGAVIAQLIIERQIEKFKTRQQFKTPGDENGGERW